MLVSVNVEKLREIRLKNGLSMYALSKKSGLGKNAIQQIESETYAKCSYIRLKEVAKQLNIDVKELVKENLND